ncbi:MFS transporter [Legionella fallonii]|uniref:Putative proline/betaine transporter n=1 Tax=Legionella fallonii LLAP-10 TaxID=1212491 RepID=A0A098G8G9_9GAMM|nr:MFS transporter [Legionella fallonii]CEG58789.1 putative proline/betaine transporter [Legionella fallonii LLAP-10]
MGLHTDSFKLNDKEKRIVHLAALGGMLEFYDFIIYGVFSVYFAQQFFPESAPLLAVIKSYAIFILGYIARPIGGMLFSHIGDEYGRKKVLVVTIVLMGLSSLAIGILPTYEQIGIVAPLLLLLFRLIQGLAIGGELPSTYVYISESLPGKQGTGFGLTMFGVNSGLLLGMAINQLLTSLLSIEELSSYGWRLPFIFGGVLCVISYHIRRTLGETSAFNKIHDKPVFPLATLLKEHLPQLVTGIAITAIMSGLAVLTIIFMPTYLNEMLHINAHLVGHIMPVMMLFNVIAIYFTGKIANRVAPSIILNYLLLLSAVLIPLSYWLISVNTSSVFLVLGLIILGVLEGVAAMIIPLIICSLFTTSIRLTGVALCYNIGFTLFGGIAPMVVSTLINMGYNVYLTPLIYLLAIVIICSFGLKNLMSRQPTHLPITN